MCGVVDFALWIFWVVSSETAAAQDSFQDARSATIPSPRSGDRYINNWINKHFNNYMVLFVSAHWMIFLFAIEMDDRCAIVMSCQLHTCMNADMSWYDLCDYANVYRAIDQVGTFYPFPLYL